MSLVPGVASRESSMPSLVLLVVTLLAIVPQGALGQCHHRGMCSHDSTCIISCSCSYCASGHYCNGGDWNYGAGFCSDVTHSCPSGKYVEESGSDSSSDCRSCPRGQYNDNGGRSSCRSCPAGRHASSYGQTSCDWCGAGQFASAGQSSCTSCAPGRVAGSSGQSSCSPCSSGRYAASSGSTSCISCPSGQVSASSSGSSMCQACSSGTYESNNACRNCAAGRFSSSSGAGSCIACSRGQYQSSSGRTDCSNCAPGHYASSTGLSSCPSCASGYYAVRSGSTSCTGCERGRYTSSSGGTSSSVCRACTSGKYSQVGESTCRDCPAGQSTDSGSGASSCTNCERGFFSSSGSASCTSCSVGSYAAHGVSACDACEGGTTDHDLDAATPCSRCPEGFYSSGRQDTCGACGGVWIPFQAANLFTADLDRDPSTPCEDCPRGAHPANASTECGVINPCHGCEVECNEPHPAALCALPACDEDGDCDAPRTIQQRSCIAASLPTPSWERSGPTTPAEEYQSVRDLCTGAVLDGVDLVERTANWLARAMDYQLQAAEDNAGVIATQLCFERRFQTVGCLHMARPGDIAALADLHDQSCALAERIGKGHSIDTMLSTSDVPPLSFDTYQETFDAVMAHAQSLNDRLVNAERDSELLTYFSNSAAVSAENAADEQQFWDEKARQEASRMSVYRQQIKEIETMLSETLQSMQLDGPALIQSVTDQISTTRRNLQTAVNSASTVLRPEERAVLQAQAAELETEQTDLQAQLATTVGSGRRLQSQAGQRQRPASEWSARLEHRLVSVSHLLAKVRERLSAYDDFDSSTASTCAATCTAGKEPPSSNGCGTDFTGQHHSWAMHALQGVTGCYSAPYIMNDVQPCCDAHDICYGTCGVTQAFCDQQLSDCMQSQAVLPSCQTTIDTSNLAVSLLGCDHFSAAQQESVAPECHDSGANNGCVESCADGGTCIEAAEGFCDTIGALAGAITANPVGNAVCTGIDLVGGFVGAPGVCHLTLESVSAATQVASAGLSIVNNVLDSFGSWIGRRLQEECESGGGDVVLCQRMQQLQAKLQAAKGLISTMASLAALNTQLVADEEISPAALAKLDMSFLDVNMLNDEVLANSFSSAVGAGAWMFETEVRHVVTLIRSKLEQMRAYYQAALAKAGHEQQRDLLARRMERSRALVENMHSDDDRLAETQAYLDAELRSYSHIGLQYVVQQVRAYEYLFLEDAQVVDLDRLRSRPMTGAQYLNFVTEAQTAIQTLKTRTAEQSNNGGNQGFAGITIELGNLPLQKARFIRTGEISLSIGLPADTTYFGVTFSDIRVFLVGLPPPTSGAVTINLVKGGTSVFKDRQGKQHLFTHDQTTPPFGFQYVQDASGCHATSSSDPRLQSGNLNDIYVRYSPYGTWTVTADAEVELQLDAVTAVRFEFNLHRTPFCTGRLCEGRPVLFDANDGETHAGEYGEAACEGPEIVVPEPAVPTRSTSPSASPPPTPTVPAGLPCTDIAEFIEHSHLVREACCDDSSSCTHGWPAQCSSGCADVLLPMATTCEAFLETSGMAADADAAAATCPAPRPVRAQLPCTDIAEFIEHSHLVREACCDDSSSCTHGWPAQCSSGCADVLLPMTTTCEAFLAMSGMAADADAAAATCPTRRTPVTVGAQVEPASEQQLDVSDRPPSIQDIPPAAMAVAAAVLVVVAFVAGKLCSKQSVAPEGSEDGAGKAATSENPVANAVVASQDPQHSVAAKAPADDQLEENTYGADVTAL